MIAQTVTETKTTKANIDPSVQLLGILVIFVLFLYNMCAKGGPKVEDPFAVPVLVRKRSNSLTGDESTPIELPPMQIVGSFSEDGLGLCDWWL